MAASKYANRPSAKWTRGATRRVAEERAQQVKEAPSRRVQPTIVTTPVEQSVSWRLLCHPDLVGLSDMEFEIRSSILPRIIMGVPQKDWINWYGGMIRRDGGQGMYMTESQADAWTDRVEMVDIKPGPG